MFDSLRKNRYADKFEKFDLYFDQLSKWLEAHPLSDLDFSQDTHWIYAIFHAFQNLAEVCADIAAMILKDEDHIPKDNYSNYLSLYDYKIISKNSQQTLQKINGLRNRV
ncbi:MAG: DUF86 domain-containing protein, partial [Promethearchaeota archaeon]